MEIQKKSNNFPWKTQDLQLDLITPAERHKSVLLIEITWNVFDCIITDFEMHQLATHFSRTLCFSTKLKYYFSIDLWIRRHVYCHCIGNLSLALQCVTIISDNRKFPFPSLSQVNEVSVSHSSVSVTNGEKQRFFVECQWIKCNLI